MVAKKKPISREASVPVDRKLKKRWDALSALIADSTGKGASAFDALWEAAGEIVTHDPPLYVFGGYKSAAAFFRDVLHESERVARRNIRVARFATPDEEAKYGTHLLDAALGYLEAKAGALDGSLPVDFARLRIPVKRNGTVRRVPLAEATVADVNAARREVLEKKGTSRAKRSDSERVLTASLGKHGTLKGVVVHEKDGFFSFQHVPSGALGLFGRTVAAHRGVE